MNFDPSTAPGPDRGGVPRGTPNLDIAVEWEAQKAQIEEFNSRYMPAFEGYMSACREYQALLAQLPNATITEAEKIAAAMVPAQETLKASWERYSPLVEEGKAVFARAIDLGRRAGSPVPQWMADKFAQGYATFSGKNLEGILTATKDPKAN